MRADRSSIDRADPAKRGTMTEPRNQNPIPQISTRRRAIVHAALAVSALGAISSIAAAASAEDVSRDAESLHQELVFKANRKRIYEIFTSTAHFDKMTHEIQAKEGGTASSSHPTEISHHVGGAFSLFGGRIIGRHLELVPDERIVQAWRVAYWDPGVFSMVRFYFKKKGSETT